MVSKFAQSALVALLLAFSAEAQSGSGRTTRYWDCCKPSCGWTGKAAVNRPVLACDKQGTKLTNAAVKSGCDSGGTAYTCVDNQPWAVSSSLALGFAAVSISGSTESQWCCECYELTFTSGPVSGQKMIVQATNTGGDLGANHFDILMPGGGVGIFNGCPGQFGSWNGGAQYGGVSSRAECDNLPSQVRAGCYWRFDWFKNADNPNVNFQKVTCPSQLVDRSGCLRNGATTTSVQTTQGPTTTNPGTTSTSGGCTVAKWGQCGGQGYTGCTTCAAGSTCTFSSQFYSQCL